MINRDTLGPKQYHEYERFSRYSTFPFFFVKEDNKYNYGITSNLQKNNVKFVTHKIEMGDTLDNISLYYYNNPLYYWIIADYNDIIDVYEDLEVGKVLKIPTFSDVKFNLGR